MKAQERRFFVRDGGDWHGSRWQVVDRTSGSVVDDWCGNRSIARAAAAELNVENSTELSGK